MITIQSNQTVFDLAILIEGKLDNMVQDILINFNISNPQDYIAGREIDAKFNISNSNVKFFYNNQLNIETGDNQLFTEWTSNEGEFNNDFWTDFDI